MTGRLAVALLLALSAAPASAELKIYPIGDGAPKSGRVRFIAVSHDGYHVARLIARDGKEVWEKDGVDFAKAEAGVFEHGDGLSAELSDDGKILLHTMVVHDKEGRAGVSAAVNGKPVGGMHAEVRDAVVSPGGNNIAFAARDADVWTVHYGQGTGPALPEPPRSLFVSDSGVIYATKWQARPWLYRNEVPAESRFDSSITATRDLKHVGGAATGDDGGHYVEIDGTAGARWTNVGIVVFSDDGRHYAYSAAKSPAGAIDTLVVDGVVRASVPDGMIANLLVDGAGALYWTANQGRSAYRDGVALPLFPSDDAVLGGRWAGFSPSGAHYAYVSSKHLVVDGQVVSESAPRPTGDIRFDGERELHYVSGLQLVCVTVDGSSAARSRCARMGRSLDKSRATRAD